MAEADSPPTSQYFNLTYPLPYVAHVEINRPEKLNAFIEPYVIHLFLFTGIPQRTKEISVLLISTTEKCHCFNPSDCKLLTMPL